MKKVLLLFAVLSVPGLVNSLLAQNINEEFKKLDWLEGIWTRTNVKPGRSGYEKWQKTSSSEWLGFGVNMNGNDTTFVERLKLVIKEDNIYYVADIVANKEPVYFKLTTITANGFVCENPDHDFPKKISYQKNGNGIKATISGDGTSMDYIFEKK